MDLYRRVRRAHYIDGKSVRQTAQLFNLHRQTVRKMMESRMDKRGKREYVPRQVGASHGELQ